MTEAALVVITCGSHDEARVIARHLVEAGLGAGVQIVPVESIYTWKGEIVEDEEWLLICKTTSGRYEQIETAVRATHSYEVVPIYMVEMASTGGPYGKWIEEVTAEPSP